MLQALKKRMVRKGTNGGERRLPSEKRECRLSPFHCFRSSNRYVELAGAVTMPRNVFIVDDNRLVRQAIRAEFEKLPDFCVCGGAGNGQEAIQRVKQLSPSPDLIILDLSMPVMNGIDAPLFWTVWYPGFH